ncbi:carboxypeptidase-like regulatory domain-containing protein [Chryseobacterium sp. JM1]|uniref:carboxypeptidase-like regulatory domain-containing protein n=1 Tax=Chryseobacterium sp. JM1 TaxID=1233950 RepID=UPI0004E6BA2E|nr:carboxypeptidase regulatory-like domain-containing protein [Chryseobacterium sp. JM1]KFF15590.1 hypothetical protein IW22_23920 [Chryseobacterium sp. JM1]
MKKTIISVILLLPVLAFSQRITGKITQTGNSVSYIEIVAVKDKTRQTAISDEKGNYSLKLPDNGNYNIKLIQDGAEVSTAEISVNGETKKDFFIEKKQEKQIEGLRLPQGKN